MAGRVTGLTSWEESRPRPASCFVHGIFPIGPQPKATVEPDQDFADELTAGHVGHLNAELGGGELGTDLFQIYGRSYASIPPTALREGERVSIRLLHDGNLPPTTQTHGHNSDQVASDDNPGPSSAQLVKDPILIGPGERYDLEPEEIHPGVWMLHCQMQNQADYELMTLIDDDAERPTRSVTDD